MPLAQRLLTATLVALTLAACGEPIELDECRDVDSTLECDLCCTREGYGDLGVQYSAGRCACLVPRDDE